MAIAKRKLKLKGNETPRPPKPAPVVRPHDPDWPEKWPTPADGFVFRVHHAWLYEVYPFLRDVSKGQKAVLFRLVKNGHFFIDRPYDAPPEANMYRLYHPAMSVVDLPSCVFMGEYVVRYPEKPIKGDEYVVDDVARAQGLSLLERKG